MMCKVLKKKEGGKEEYEEEAGNSQNRLVHMSIDFYISKDQRKAR